MDCPEAIGFDLCGECHDSGLHIDGRFAQKHGPGHRMELVPAVRGALHVLTERHPELSVEQLIHLTRLAVADAGDDDGGEGGDEGGGRGGDDAAADADAGVDTATVTLTLDPAALPPDFPFASVAEIEAFFEGVERQGLASLQPETADILRRFFPGGREEGRRVAGAWRGFERGWPLAQRRTPVVRPPARPSSPPSPPLPYPSRPT